MLDLQFLSCWSVKFCPLIPGETYQKNLTWKRPLCRKIGLTLSRGPFQTVTWRDTDKVASPPTGHRLPTQHFIFFFFTLSRGISPPAVYSGVTMGQKKVNTFLLIQNLGRLFLRRKLGRLYLGLITEIFKEPSRGGKKDGPLRVSFILFDIFKANTNTNGIASIITAPVRLRMLCVQR